jgi:hypothetical protein
MSEFVIKKAVRKAKKLKIGISAASGFGKTYGALLIAKGLCQGDLSKVCVIDSENDSASLYADLGEYSTISLKAPYTPERYIQAIKHVEQSGFAVCIIDSITHEWDGEGGCLQIQSDLGGRYQDWAKVTPRHTAFINKILNSSLHVITTVRRKQDYEMTSANGRTSVQKVGTKEQTREGFEYELDVNFEVVNKNHMVICSKDRTRLFESKAEFVITEETGKELYDWSNTGADSTIDDALEQVRNSNDIQTLTSVYNTFLPLIGNHADFVEALKVKKASLV